MATIPTGKSNSWSISKKAKGEDNYGIGITFTIAEPIDRKTDFRMTGSKNQYFTFKVTDGKEIRDLRLPSGAIVALGLVMPQEGTWEGQKFVVDGVEGSGYETKTKIRGLGFDQQRRISDAVVDSSGAILAEMKKADGMDRGSFSTLVMKHVNGDMSAAFTTIEKLKKEGKIIEDKDMWRSK